MKKKKKMHDFAYLFDNCPFEANSAPMTVSTLRLLLNSLNKKLKGKDARSNICEIKKKTL